MIEKGKPYPVRIMLISNLSYAPAHVRHAVPPRPLSMHIYIDLKCRDGCREISIDIQFRTQSNSIVIAFQSETNSRQVDNCKSTMAVECAQPSQLWYIFLLKIVQVLKNQITPYEIAE